MIVAACLYMLIFCLAVGLLWKEQLWNAYQAAVVAGWVFFAIALLFGVLLLLLIALHVYLTVTGVTTFQFIMDRRMKEQKENE
jgi:uncharacterized membrane protein YcjF (UPF0283 family)